MTDIPTIRSCPQCEQPLPPDAPEGLCPECLMLGGLETMPMPEGYTPSGALPMPGDTFGGYRIGKELGRGGMGAVFEAEQIETGRRVALKLLNHQLDSPEARARFFREGRLAASVNHPNSVYVFGTEEIGDIPAIAMEMVGGGTLEEHVKENGPLPIGEAVDAIIQIIAGLEAAQEIGILHRDVKPGNCFREIDGTVKVGDFGLSISTEARDENHLTMDGTIFGTPAFASPEQLRGEELNVRSDIYAVGATLFYLLTGRPAFTGKSVAQLFANVLEGKTPSPREIRPDIPKALVTAVMRCLEKVPADRYCNYAEIRRALDPFSSAAPVAAPVSLRLVAGVIDWVIYGAAVLLIQVLFSGGLIIPDPETTPRYALLLLSGLIVWALYFGILEGRFGSSLGKSICRIAVRDRNGNPPGYLKATARAVLIILVPSLPIWISACFDPVGFAIVTGDWVNILVMSSFYLILALMFSTVRKRNGRAAVHDLITKTRVIRKKVFQDRPVPETESFEPAMADAEAPRIGPYHMIEVLEEGGDSIWMIGYDTRLLRKIWIRKVPPGTPAVAPVLRQLGRVGRLRWLSGRRSAGENWDAYESPGGLALSDLIEKESPTWDTVRYWLLDLAEEFAIAEEEGNLPDTLSLNHLWITASGHAKLLDFPAPGGPSVDDAGKMTPTELLDRVASLASQPLPLHASNFRSSLPSHPGYGTLIASLKRLIGRPVLVTRKRRAILLLACIAFPLCSGAMMVSGAQMLKVWQQQQPEIVALNQIFAVRNAMNPHPNEIDDELFAVYIVSNYKEVINDPVRWDSQTSRMLISPPKRKFAEQSLVDYPNPTDSQVRKAKEMIGPMDVEVTDNPFNESWLPLFAAAVALVIYVGLPAILASVICRGGLVMLVCGVAVTRLEGTRASRLRCLWRSLVTWSPWLLAPVLIPLLRPSGGITETAPLVCGFAAVLAAISLCLPERSLQDRIAGTCLVPR